MNRTSRRRPLDLTIEGPFVRNEDSRCGLNLQRQHGGVDDLVGVDTNVVVEILTAG